MNNPHAHTERTINGSAELVSSIPLTLIVLFTGLIISLYTLFVRQFTTHGTPEDCVKQAALFACTRLSQVSVDDDVFGRVGLCDVSNGDGSGQPRTISLNSLYATLRLDHLIAQRLGLTYMDGLIDDDFIHVRQIETRLQAALADAAGTMPSGGTPRNQSIYAIAKNMVAKADTADRTLVDFQLKLGSSSPASFGSRIPACGSAHEPFVELGRYKAGIDVPITRTETATFYQLAPQLQTTDAAHFETLPVGVTPSMVLVEATFQDRRQHDKVGVSQKLTACAVAGSSNIQAPPSVLMISFPHGAPNQPNTLQRLVSVQTAKTGTWQQSAGGAIPGKGRLVAAAGLPSADMPAGNALQTAFYHWLRSLGPTPRLEQVQRLLAVDWSATPVDQTHSAVRAEDMPAFNSALTKDTGARAFAFLYQTAAGGNGQPVLNAAFNGVLNPSVFPQSSVPLQIDSHGQCNIGGRKGFDQKLVQEFLDDVYRTYRAGMESARVARSVSDRLTHALKQTASDESLTNEELNSVSSRLGRVVATSATKSGAEIDKLRKSQTDLTAAVAALKAKREEFERVKKRAEICAANADYTTRVTYDICANMATTAQHGIFYASHPDGFLLDKDEIFVPKVQPVTEEEIYRAEAKTPEDIHSWTAAHFNVLEHTAGNTTIEGHPLSALAQMRTSDKPQPRFILFDSRQLTSGPVAPVVLGQTPFAGAGLPEGQLAFYAQDALQTGNTPPVGWSILLRDLIAQHKQTPGTPVFSKTKWCDNELYTANTCPPLALEIQVRSPVPLLPDLPVGSYLIQPLTGERVSQIPPMPAGML